ncbi:MAG: aldehyde dehydrogenase [Dehalococcoidales bacterium]|nr:aldehyde dehydrogenase [Dehalococcoidales bacterium]
MADYKMLIDGELVEAESGKTIPVINPATGEQFATVACGDEPEVNKAAAAAKKAYPLWSKMPVQKRADALRKVAARIRERNPEIGMLDCRDHGTPIRMAMGMAMMPAMTFEKAAADSQTLWSDALDLEDGNIAYQHRQPVGICGIITPWNVPLMVASSKVAPALVTGNTVILKPPSIDSATSLVLGQIFAELSDIIPPGTFNVITGPGEKTGHAIAAHPDVRLINFTGSTDAGRSIMAAASGNIKRLNMELGGKNPFIVMEEADLDLAATEGVRFQANNSGQICISPGRYYVHEKVYDEFLEKYIAEAKKVVVGDPLDEKTMMGPVVGQVHRDSIEEKIRSALDQGATMELGQLSPLPAPLDKGYYIPFTVLTGVTPEMRVYREEIFGPVACITKYSDNDDVIAMANDNEYGLAGTIWSKDIAKAIKAAHRLEAGSVWINRTMTLGPLPGGGVKQSGIGKKDGRNRFDVYCEVNEISVNMP